ncbi:MAG TPA: beta-ketoacyl-ACP synthase II [Planctomycetota bacterium]|nr:beta-ketoacyl-ACP synthase II [Planctomycetota bacterium]
MTRRVAITGLGALCALGKDVESIFDGLLHGRSGVVKITKFDTSKHSTKIAGEVREFDPTTYFPKLEGKRLDLFSAYAIYAADRALEDAGAGKSATGIDRDRFGCIMGTGIGGILELEVQQTVLLQRGADRVNPFLVPKMMANAMSGQIAIRHGLRGTNYATSSACASAGHAIGLAFRSVKAGESDLVLTGGSEAATTPLGLAGFCSLKALSTRNDDPEHASRPFDKDRDGFVMGEGAGCLVFEELEHAKKRGAKIYAEVLGFGSTDDAFHITAPDENGDGARRAMLAALQEANARPESVDYVNAHGTSTPLNDRLETVAIKRALGEHAKKIPVSSTKSMIGHLLGASAAVELVVTALSTQRNVVHPTANLVEPDPECDLDYVPGAAREVPVRLAISNSFGFGGHNVCLAIGKLR